MLRRPVIILLVLCLFCQQVQSLQTIESEELDSPPRLLTWDGKSLYKIRQKLSRQNTHLTLSVSTALAHIKSESEKWHAKVTLGRLPLVTDKKTWPADASANHYVSYVPYAHACTELPKDCVDYKGRPVDNSDCDASTKLPWRICDDRLNIRARDLYTDRPRLEAMMHGVMRLSLTAYLFRNQSHANAAVRLLNAWFVDSETRMLPTLRYAQGVPGVVDGKPSGCIDLSIFGRGFADAVTLLLQSPETRWATDDVSIFKAWCTDMLLEMLNHPRVSSESRMRNNHGLYYDLTVLSLSALSDTHPRPTQIRRMLSNTCEGHRFCVHGRLADQADADGVQVHESMRPGYGHYVWYTLLAHVHLYSMVASYDLHEPLDGSAMMRIVGWTTRHWNNVTGAGEEWQVYGVQAYQMIARWQHQYDLHAEICEMLHQMWRRFKARGVWHDNRIGMDIWNLVYPVVHRTECAVWSHFERLPDTLVTSDSTGWNSGSSSKGGQESASTSRVILDRGTLQEAAADAHWMTVLSVFVWSAATAFFIAVRYLPSSRKKMRAALKQHWWHALSLPPGRSPMKGPMRRSGRLISDTR